MEKEQKTEEELMKLLRPGRSSYLKIEQMVTDSKDAYSLLIIEPASHHTSASIELLRYLSAEGYFGLHVTLNTPLETLLETLDNRKIKYSNFVFIDGISNTSDAKKLEGEKYKYIESPRDLVDLVFIIDEEIAKIKTQKKFLVVDSISTLLIYNSPQAIQQFAHTLTGKMRAWKLKGILIAMDDTDGTALNSISQFCDKTVRI